MLQGPLQMPPLLKSLFGFPQGGVILSVIQPCITYRYSHPQCLIMHLSSHWTIGSTEAEILIFAILNFSKMIDSRCTAYENSLIQKYMSSLFCMLDPILALGTQQ